MSAARRGWSRRAYCLQLADFFRKLPDESLVVRRKDAVKEVKDAQGALLTLDAEIARRLADVSASVPTAARHDGTNRGGRP